MRTLQKMKREKERVRKREREITEERGVWGSRALGASKHATTGHRW